MKLPTAASCGVLTHTGINAWSITYFSYKSEKSAVPDGG